MSALGSKAERQPKSRFQSLDINNLYCTSRGDTVEQLTQKSSVPRKHGMQSLGKVPTARRPPANLPSIRAEATTTSSNTTIVNNSTSTSAATTDPQQQQQQQVQQQQAGTTGPVPNAAGQGSWASDSKNPAAAQPAVSPQLPQPVSGVTSPQQAQQLQHSNAAGNTWSAVAVGAGLSHQDHHHSHHQHPPSYQSPQFQHEFPSLDGHTPNVQTQKPGPDAQYGPGPSLRPQTEGSWIQGGRSSSNSGSTEVAGAPAAGPPVGGATAGGAGAPMGGPALQQVHPQFQAIMPSFMYRGSGGAAGNFGLPQNFGAAPTTARNQARPQNSYNETQGSRDNRRGPPISKRDIDLSDAPLQRPIIKEEDLDKMEDIARDVGWAAHDDIDYNQKLAFSDDESSEPAASPAPIRESSRESSQSQSNRITHSSSAPPPSTITNDAQTNQRQISPSPGKVKSASIEKNIEDSNNANSGSGASRGPMWSSRNTQSRDVDYRQNGHQRNAPRNVLEDDEIWIQRRKQTHERIERAQELAKLRREEEDRKFMETKMAANKKLLELEQKISAKKNSTSQDGVKDSASDNTINSSSNQDSHSNSGMHQLQGSVSSDGLEFRQMSQIGNGGPSSVSGRGFVQWNASVQEQQSAGGDRDHHRDPEPRIIMNSHERDRNGPISSGRDLDSGGGTGSGGGGGGPNFSKQFQIDLPPRFRNQAEKNHIGGQRGGGSVDKVNNVPFAQQYDTRWVHPPTQTYTKSSSMSGVQSGGGSNNNTMSRRAPSADDVAQQHRGSNNNLSSTNLQQYQNLSRQQSGHSLNRSMSDTSQRKLSVSSEDRSSTTSSHNLEGSPPKSELKTSESCREFGSSWADEPLENEKLLYGNNKTEDDRKSIKDSDNNEMIKLSDKQSWPDSTKHTVDVSLKNSNNNKLNETTSSNKQVIEITQVSISKNNDLKTDKELLNEDYRSGRDSGNNKRMSPKVSTRQMGSRGGRNFDNFRRGQDQSGVNNPRVEGHRKNIGGGGRTRGVGGHSGGDHAWSETDGSEEHEDDRKKGRRSPKQLQQQLSRDSNHHHQSQQQQSSAQNQHHGMQQRSTSSGSLKQEPRQPAERSNTQTSLNRGSSHQEGFAPRGEPSRRGRGSAYRTSRGAMKNVDYGPPRRTFGGDEMNKPRNESSSGDNQGLTSDDRTKLKQQALSAGIGISTSSSGTTSTSNTASSGNANSSNVARSGGGAGASKASTGGSGGGSSRMRSGGRGKNASGKNSDEAWDTTSDHSESGGNLGQGKRRENRDKDRDRGNSRTGKPRNERKNNAAQNKNSGSSQISGKSDDPSKKTSETTNNTSSSLNQNQQANSNAGSKKDALEGIDLNNFASVVVIDEQLEKTSSAQNSSGQQSSSDGDGFQEVRNKKGAKKTDEPAISAGNASNQTGNQNQQALNQTSGQQQAAQQNQQRSSSTRGEKKERSSSKGASNKNAQSKQSTNATNNASQQQSQQVNNSSNNASSKAQSDRPRQSKLPPRFARQKENIRMQQRAQAQDINVMAPMPPPVNAWDKPITASLRPNIESDNAMTIDSEAIVNITNESGQNSQRSTPGTNNDGKLVPTKAHTDPKSALDGTTPPVQTIIFENTNYKSGPNQNQTVKQTEKRDNDIFKTSSLDIMETTTPVSRDGQLSGLQLSFQSKTESDYDKDMKLSFNFDSDLAQLTEDKNTKVLGLPRSMHSSSSQSTISPSTAELNLKIQSVKKVWENAPVMPTVLEQQASNEDAQHNLSSPHNLGSHQAQHNLSKHQAHANLNQMNQMASQAHAHNHGLVGPGHNLTSQHNLSPAATYASSFGGDPSMEHFGKSSDGNDNENVYSPGPQHVTPYNHVQQMNKHNDMNSVCKVKQPQSMHPSGLGGISGGSQGLGLSPPPSLQQQQQAPQQQYYQAAQYGSMSAIPSPPAVLFNSTAAAMLGSSQLAPQQQQQQLYGAAAFQMEQGRGAYSQFPGHYAGANAPYNYMQTTPSLPQPTPDMYQSLTSQYRAMGGAPFGQSQQLNNPSTVLISSTSNSLMSASVKPSNQIGAIGSKSGSAGPGHYAPQQPPQYMGVAYPPPPQPGPLTAGSSYFGGAGTAAGGAGSAGGSQGGSQGAAGGAGGGSGFYAPPTGAAPGGFSLAAAAAAAGMFGGNQPPPPPGPPQAQVQGQGYASQFLTSPLQLAATMQQYRGPQSAYLKNLPDPCSRPLKSPIGESLGQMKQIQPQHKSYQSSVMQGNNNNSSGGACRTMQAAAGQAGPVLQGAGPSPHHHSSTSAAAAATITTTSSNNNSSNGQQQQQIGARYPGPIQRPTTNTVLGVGAYHPTHPTHPTHQMHQHQMLHQQHLHQVHHHQQMAPNGVQQQQQHSHQQPRGQQSTRHNQTGSGNKNYYSRGGHNNSGNMEQQQANTASKQSEKNEVKQQVSNSTESNKDDVTNE